MKKMKIEIPGMQSAHCQMNVSKAITTVEGVTIDAIQPGIAFITISDENRQSEVLTAIRNAGYTVNV